MRTKRTLSLTTRALQQTEQQRQQTMMTLLSVLAQAGGEITITKGTIQQVIEQYAQLAFSTGPGTVEGEFVVKMVTRDAADTAPVEATPEITQ